MGKESFLARAPAFMGDILWEHLELLQKGKKILKNPQKIFLSFFLNKKKKTDKHV